ncbi:MAG: hypothetical protein ACK4IB_08420 [Erythrobacter sp.]
MHQSQGTNMRTALLSANLMTASGVLRADLLLAGRSVLAWQSRLAQGLGCQRIIVLSAGKGEAVAALEQDCKVQGIAFQRLSRFADLAAVLHTEDELLIFGDGLVPDRATLTSVLAQQGTGKPLRKAVLCVPDDHGEAVTFPEDFERIDAARCWAGVVVMRAGPVQGLDAFPPDSNPISLLLRMALQGGTPCHTLTASERAAPKWFWAHNTDDINAHERALVAQHRSPVIWTTPGLALADWLAARIGMRRIVAAAPGVVLGGLVLLLAAIGCALQYWELAAVLCAALGSFALDLGGSLARIRENVLDSRLPLALVRAREPGRDLLVCGVLAAALGLGPLAALGLLAVGNARLAERFGAAAFWQDRTAQLALLAVGSGLALLAEATALFALLALAQCLFTNPARPIPE